MCLPPAGALPRPQKILLDENFPLDLHQQLKSLGHDVDHIIPLRIRGIPDQEIVRRMRESPCIFLTQDDDFFDQPKMGDSVVLLSRVPQRLPISERTRIWVKAIQTFFENFKDSKPRLYEIGPTGEIIPWKTIDARLD